MIAAVEAAGAVAAITAVACGVATLGLEPAEVERFLARDGVRKVSARDLAAAIVDRADGATTVAGTLAIASRAGARVFATGGIGGVHRTLPRQVSQAVDESADLMELARTPMIVVSAGAKSILDLEATWERLDTLGVPVIGFGTAEFPAFYSTTSGIPLHMTADSPARIAEIAAAHFALGRPQAVLVVQPPPANLAISVEVIESAVSDALRQAVAEGIRGAAVTPYLLAAVSSATAGRSLETNLGLLESNARLAAEIAAVMPRSDRSTT